MVNSETLEQSGNQVVTTKISAVTVYTNQALVTRLGRVTLSEQIKNLVIIGLPLTIQTESIRANGVGTTAVKLLGVRTERIFTTESLEERIAQLVYESEKVESQCHNLQDAIDSLVMQRDLIKDLGEKSVGRFSASLARQQVNLQQTKELISFIGQQYNDYALAIAEGKKEKQELDNQLQALQFQLQSLQRPNHHESYNLIVAIAAASVGDFELEISYVVNNASWTPLYDLRVTEGKVNLTYLAEVEQNSGEDWLAAKLTLSTAKPGLGTLPPKLNPWYIDVFRPIVPQPMMRAMSAPSSGAGSDYSSSASMDTLINGGSRLEESIYAAETVIAEIKDQGGVVTFAINGDSDIPSDRTPHKITIFNDDYVCRMSYIAIPKVVSFAYLQATVTNAATGATLLPGQANIFREQMFVGTTRLPNIAPGQEFELNLGIDEGIKIERNLVEREVDKRFISGQRRTTYAYRLIVTNLRDRIVSLKLTEQLPVSRNEKIKVQLARINPQVSPSEMGLLEWSLVLQPQAKQEIYYQFTVEHPPDLSLTGLNI